MDIDNFEWWYSEGEAPDEEWDEPAPRDVSSDEDETGNDAAAEPDTASDPAEPLTFEQAWAQAEADEAKADATATLGEPVDMSISPAKTPQPRHTIDPDSTASFSILDVPSQGAQAPAPTHRPDLAREEDAGRRSPLGPILIAFMAGVIACSAIGNVWSHVEQQRKDAAKVEMSVEQSLSRTRSVHVSVEVKDGATWDTARGDSQMPSISWDARSKGRRSTSINTSIPLVTVSNLSPATTSSPSMNRPSPPTARASAPQSAWFP